MELMVCFKIVSDMENAIASDWAAMSSGERSLPCTGEMINAYDESALEYALRVKDVAEDAHITAVCMGASIPEPIYKNLFAVGVDRVVLLENDGAQAFAPGAAASALAAFYRRGAYDAVFLGQQDSVSCGGQTGARLAIALRLPYVGYVTDLSYQDDCMNVSCKTTSGTRHAVTAVNAVFAFQNAAHPYLRVATLRERLRVKDCAPERTPAKVAAEAEGEMELVSLAYCPPQRKCIMIAGETPMEQAKQFLAYYQACGGDIHA